MFFGGRGPKALSTLTHGCKILFSSYLQTASQSLYAQFQSRMIWIANLLLFCKLSAQRLMVKSTEKSDLPWSTIFSVIVYCCFLLSTPFSRHLKTRQLEQTGYHLPLLISSHLLHVIFIKTFPSIITFVNDTININGTY